jgi:hypothetical protein
MKDLWMDPVVLVSGGVIAAGIIFLLLALRALQKSSKPGAVKEFDFPSFVRPEPLSVVSPDSNPFAANTVVPPPVAVANKDVLQKVDLISQRLVDMQMLLNKQVSVSAHAAGNNPGLSPEMLDKLLRITSTVAQHIDVLQKALGAGMAPPANTAPPAADTPFPGTAARSTPAMTPVSQVIGSSGKTPPAAENP